MRFANRFFPSPSRRRAAGRRLEKRSSTFAPRLEALEKRELLSLSPTSADFAALSNSFVRDDGVESAIWVTTLSDKTAPNDGAISLREAIDYAGTTVDGRTVSSTIRFSLGGKITLAKTLSVGKDLTIDASDVGGVVLDRAGQGQVLLAHNGKTNDPRSLSLTALTLTGGAAPSTSTAYSGAGVYLGAYCNLTAVDCSIVGNVSPGGTGVGVYVRGGALTLIDSVVADNASSGTSFGGGIYVDSGTLTATRTTFDGNSASEGGSVYLKGGSATFDGVRFVDSAATRGSGGAIYDLGGAFSVENSSFVGASATGDGGAIYVAGNDATSVRIADSYFVDSSATSGGALSFYAATATLTGGEISGCAATENGGAIRAASNVELRVDGVAFSGNSADVDGGAIYNEGFLALDATTTDGDVAKSRGGAVFSTGYFEIRDALFSGDRANEGGAIYVASETDGAFFETTSWLLRSTLTGGGATLGGAVCNAGFLSAVGTRFAANEATSGGGAIYNAGTFLLTDAEIDGNVAGQVGGGIVNAVGGSFATTNVAIRTNVARTQNGGGFANFGSATLDSTTARANVASAGFGGGLFNAGTLAVRASTIADNRANDGGGAANALSGTATFSNSTLSNNVAAQFGGAVYCVGSTSFAASYLANNVASTLAAAAVYLNPGSDAQPTFDASTKQIGNVAASSVVPLVVAESVVFSDAATGAVLDGPFEFGDLALGTAGTSRTFAAFNAGADALRLSNPLVLLDGLDSTAAWTYSLKRADGTAIDGNSSFDLASGETIYVEIVAAAKKIGAKSIELRWTAKKIGANGAVDAASAATVRVAADVAIVRAVSARTSTSDVAWNFGDDGAISVVLKTKPTANVVVILAAPDGVELSTDVLVFTPENYSTSQRVDVALAADAATSRELLFAGSATVSARIASSDPIWLGAAISDLEREIGAFVAFVGDSAVDLSAAAPSAAQSRPVFWDLNGDGTFETKTTAETPRQTTVSELPDDATTLRYQTTNAAGATVEGAIAVVRVDAAPTVDAKISTAAATPNFVRFDATAQNGAIARWRIRWGDGSPATESNELATAASFAHYYEKSGTFVVSAELIDANGVGTGVWVEIGIATIPDVRASDALFEELAQEENESDDALDPFGVETASFGR